jgi:hypothetical protein
MPQDTKRRRLDAQRSQLEAERTSWLPHWQDLADYIAPSRGRFLVSERNRGENRRGKIVDSTGALAARTLGSGMLSGIANPARPWLRLTTADPDLAEYGPVKEWLHFAETRMLDVFRISNLYGALHVVWGDTGVFGIAAMPVVEDAETVVRASTLPIGTYSLSANARGVVDTCVRHYSMTVRQLVEEFGREAVSQTVRNLWDRGTYEAWSEVVHVVGPNPDHDQRNPLAKHKRYHSCYYELSGGSKRGDPDFLRESGFDRFPILCPRWEVTGEDVYGGSPGQDALPDIKQLQSMVKKKGRAVEKMIDPPLVAGPEMRNSTVAGIAGGVTYATFRDGKPSVSTLHEVRPPVGELRADIGECQLGVRRAFYEDLFLMLAMSDRRQITAREIAERHEEKLVLLGPALQRTDYELLNPLVDVVFDAMLARDLLPPAPDVIEGQDLKVEYINTLAQAQRMLGIGGIESLLGMAAQAAAIKPDIVDKIDLDQAIDEYGEKLGVSPRVLRSDERVAEIRGQRAQEQAQQAQAMQMREAAAAAKDLSSAKTGGDNALGALLRMGQPAA